MSLYSKILACLIIAGTAICSSVSVAQTASPRYPINGDRVSPTPKFTATPESLVFTGVTYNIVVSEQPRGGGAGVDQYIDFWTKEGVSANSLLESNLNRLGWDSTWVRKTRNGSFTGIAAVVPNATPASLTPGKQYYWHIYGTNGTKSVENTFTIIDAGRPTPIHNSPANGTVVSGNSQNPCFSWSMSNASGFTEYTVMVSTTPDFPTFRWMYKLTSISSTSTCWNNGTNWQFRGSAQTVNPAPLVNGTTYYWRVVASYSDGAITGRDFVGNSFVYRTASSSVSSALSTSRSSSSTPILSSSASSRSSSNSSSSVSSLAPKVTRYTYDARGRITKVMRTGGGSSSVQTQYTYDKANNRRAVITTGSNN